MNKKLFILFIIFITIGLVIGLLIASCNKPQTNAANQYGDKIEELVSKMTIEEKIGQMTQVTLDVISVGEIYNVPDPHRLDTAKLMKAITEYHVGSILNNAGHAYSQEHWHSIISQIQDAAVNKTRLGIPIIYGIDAIHGVNYTIGSTLFPQQINMAASRNPEAVQEIGAVVAYETRASSIPWNFSPVLDLGRNAAWPRFWETFGEDVFLAKVMGKALVKGYEGDDISDKTKVAACTKHYFAYSAPLSGKDRTPAWIPERYLREYFLPSFQAAFEQGAHTLMVNSAEVNGIPAHANSWMLTEVLRNELNFKGLAVSDWEDIKYLYTRHKIAASPKEAVKLAILAGIDMSMVPDDFSFYTYLLELVNEGEISEERINESVRRILWVKQELGLFETPVTHPQDYPDFGSEKFRLLSKNAAIESLTLLKNEDQTLPLSKDKKVLLVGPAANSMRALNGGWSYTWQGEQTDEYAKDKNTILEAIQQKIGEAKVVYVLGSEFEKEVNIAEAVSKAKSVDAVVLCIGENSYTEKPGDIDDLYLPQAQVDLANALIATGKPMVMVLVEGRPRIISKINENYKSVLMAYLPGNEGGEAIADVLFGDANPSGKLPYTYPRFPNALVAYDHKFTEQLDMGKGRSEFYPQFEFGTGLSYTTFEYGNLKLSSTEFTETTALTISVDVKNTGSRVGKETVELYISDLYASITPSVKRLRGFSKIELNPGETKTVSFEVRALDMAFVGIDNKWITEKGEFKAQIGSIIQNFFLK
jgi:beta-glucosidase